MNPMKAKLHITEVTIQNYKGFGDAITIQLDNLGPVLVTGDNGVGKTTGFADAIIWCLFDRTISDQRPGNDIINWSRGKDTLVEVKTIDGWIIKRTRKMSNHDDLLLYHLDTDITPSTNKNAQAKIHDLFGLDYDIFTSSILFGQSPRSPSFMKLGDQKRKSAIERILSLDRLSVRSEVAGEMLKVEKEKLLILNTTIIGLARDKERMNNQIINNESMINNYEKDRQTQLSSIQKRIDEIKVVIGNLQLPDIITLTKKWELVDKIDKKVLEIKTRKIANEAKSKQVQLNIAELNGRLSIIDGPIDIADLESSYLYLNDYKSKRDMLNDMLIEAKKEEYSTKLELKSINEYIDNWHKLSGKVCITCGQMVDDSHVAITVHPHEHKLEVTSARYKTLLAKVKKYSDDLVLLDRTKPDVPTHTVDNALRHNDSIISMNNNVAKLTNSLNDIKSQLIIDESQLSKVVSTVESNKPSMTLAQAHKIVGDKCRLDSELNREFRRLDELKTAANPYSTVIESIRLDLANIIDEISIKSDEVNQLNTTIRHLEYIRKAYGDRNKIKRILLSDLIPYFNKRIKHYGEIFELPIDISFTNTLSIESSTWPYDGCSGGQQCRIDVAVMFALYDLLLSMYGPQCNIMIMDEIDKELDQKGVQAFVESVNYFSSNPGRPNTVFVISHKPEMKSAFPSEIVVEIVDGFTEISM